ncbi:glycosyltransferase [Rhodohalobacter sp. 614A]|uniref:glycosyltransferase n=1 Tax=Rhodohalobacter sp. 614A TaxID=2908649 RepID=UPI001F250104|nr:glycosyltransferase [Rhodohalobacter sp. 614A]
MSSPKIDQILRWYSNRAYIYFGRLAPSKGLDIILKSWIRLAKDNPNSCPPIWIIGGTPKEIVKIKKYSGINNEIDLYENQKKIIWWGYIDQKGISTILSKALVLVTHSRYEPGGRVILEAMSRGVPVIATPHGFACDLVADWISGFIVNYEDIHMLQNRMSLFFKQPFLTQALGERARYIAKEKIKEWDFYNRHFQTYDAIVTDRPLQISSNSNLLHDFEPIYKRRFVRLFGDKGEFDNSSDLVLKWADSIVGPIKSLNAQKVNGKSQAWIANGEKDSIWIKKIHNHFCMTPIWLPEGTSQYCHSALQKFKSEIYNKNESLIRTIASNKDYLLVAFPIYRALPIVYQTHNIIEIYKRPLKNLANNSRIENEVDLESIVKKCISSYENFDIKKTNKLLGSTLLNKISPTPIDYRFSIRIYLIYLMKAASNESILVPQSMNAEFIRLYSKLKILAECEEKMPIVLNHNAAKPHHFVQSDRRIILIDKERLSFGFMGKDGGQLIANLAQEYSYEQLKRTLNIFSDSDEEKIIIAIWIGVHLIEEAGFSLACEQNNKLKKIIYAWNHWYRYISTTLLP